MSVAVRRIVEIVIVSDLDGEADFDAWLVDHGIKPIDRDVYRDRMRWVVAAEHEGTVREWLGARFPDPAIEALKRARPAIVAELKADLEARYPIPKKR